MMLLVLIRNKGETETFVNNILTSQLGAYRATRKSIKLNLQSQRHYHPIRVYVDEMTLLVIKFFNSEKPCFV